MSLRSVLTDSFLTIMEKNPNFASKPNLFEIESKIGILNSHTSYRNQPKQRLNIPIETPALYSGKATFSSDMDPKIFHYLLGYHIKHFSKHMSIHHKIDQIFPDPSNYKSKTRVESQVDISPTSPVSWNPRRDSQQLLKLSSITGVIAKTNLIHHNITYPSKSHDIRISFNTEVPQPRTGSPGDIIGNTQPTAVRFKKRWSVPISFFTFDFTVVDSLYLDRAIWQQSFEIEIEIQNPYLVSIFKNQKNSRNKLYDAFSQLISNSIRLVSLASDQNLISVSLTKFPPMETMLEEYLPPQSRSIEEEEDVQL